MSEDVINRQLFNALDIKSLPVPRSNDPTNSPAGQQWHVRGRQIPLARPLVFGILNATPDSFSDGGMFDDVERALIHAARMVEEGADGIDVGGESTRPQGATPVSTQQEIERVLPILSAIRGDYPGIVLSIDTTKSEVARAALDAGVDAINDVSGFRIDPRIGEIAAAERAGVVLMHSRGGVAEMGTYRYAEYGDDVVADVVEELRASASLAVSVGIPPESIVIDPGIGFAKRSEHSLRILAGLARFESLGFPIMIGVSRKRIVGELSGVQSAPDRVAGTVGANVVALLHGARLFRVHDVRPNREALEVAWGIIEAGRNQPPSIPDSRFPIPDAR